MDDRRRRALRALVRKRANALGALVLCPFAIVILTVKILEPMDYPAGDVRNSMVFRLSLYGVLTIVLIAVIMLAARWLLADHGRE